MGKKSNDFFWLSYSDLMTSLFFIMLVLFFLVYSIMKYQQGRLIERIEEYEKIEEIKLAINSIDTSFYKYDETYKKHILNIKTHFEEYSKDINDIPLSKRKKLVQAGKVIITLLNSLPQEENINYMVIVEGQASKDRYYRNDILSYERALSLKRFWLRNGIDFKNINNCELVIAGSGIGGVPRQQPDIPPNNQRFLIHIIPKVGQIDYGRKNNTEDMPIEEEDVSYIEKEEFPNLSTTLYRISNLKFEITNQKPDISKKNILSCLPIAFTDGDGSIDGIFVKNGNQLSNDLNNGLNGLLLIEPEEEDVIIKTSINIDKVVRNVISMKGSLLQQVLLIDDKKIVSCSLWGNRKHQRRALVVIDKELFIAESQNSISIKDFQNNLLSLDTDKAIYMDMGSYSKGWIKIENEIEYIGIEATKHGTNNQSNWLLIKQ